MRSINKQKKAKERHPHAREGLSTPFCYMAAASAYPRLGIGVEWKIMSAFWVGVFTTSMLVSIVYMIKKA